MFEIGASIASLLTLKDVSVALVNERDRQKATAIQVEFTGKLFELQTHVQQLLDTVIQKQGLVATLERCLPRACNLAAISVMDLARQAVLDVVAQLWIGHQLCPLRSSGHQFRLPLRH